MMYMSGRSLHPISVNLAKKLRKDFKAELLLSFSAGADAFNISRLNILRIQNCNNMFRYPETRRLYEA